MGYRPYPIGTAYRRSFSKGALGGVAPAAPGIPHPRQEAGRGNVYQHCPCGASEGLWLVFQQGHP